MPLHVKLHLKTGIHRSTRQGGRQTESLTFVFRAPGIKSKRTPSDKNQALNLDGVDLTAAADTLLLPSLNLPFVAGCRRPARLAGVASRTSTQRRPRSTGCEARGNRRPRSLPALLAEPPSATPRPNSKRRGDEEAAGGGAG